jgi:ankyrin repeat protein
MSKRFLLTLILSGVTALVMSGCVADADIEVRDEYGRTPLHLAALGNSPDIARLLIDSGANIDALAALGNSLEVAQMLIDSGANIDAKDNAGETALHFAA